MDLKWWKMIIIILSAVLCLVFTVTEAQISITINGSSTRRTLLVNDIMTIKCTVPSNYTIVSSLRVRRRSISSYKYYNTGALTKTITCDDDTYFQCYGRLNGTVSYSNYIYVTVECAPTWSELVQQPVIFSSSRTDNKYFDCHIIGNPQPTYSVQKITSTGLQDLSPNIDVIGYNKYVRLIFQTYTEESHGVYQIVANNSMGTFTTNITLRGPTVPPKNLRAWSTTTNSIQLEWTAGEIFETAPRYRIYYKQEGVKWSRYVTIFDIGSTVNYTFTSTQPNTTYYFLVKTYYVKSSYSFYANMAMATTLNPGDPPETKPPIFQTVKPTSTSSVTSMEPTASTIEPTTSSMEPTTSTSGVTSVELTTTLGLPTSVAKPVKNKESELNGGKKDVVTFEVGIGIGIGIGLILLIIAVIGTVVYFKRSSVKREKSSDRPHNTITRSESENWYENLDDVRRHAHSEDLYQNLDNSIPNDKSGVRYDNKAYNASL